MKITSNLCNFGTCPDYNFANFLRVSSVEEAYYLCGVLNSDEAINNMRNLGILNERHIQKKIFDLPIPEYDGKNILHRNISTTSMEITRAVAEGRKITDDDITSRMNEIRPDCSPDT